MRQKFVIVSILYSFLLNMPAAVQTDEDQDQKGRLLPLKPDRTLELETDEVTWMSLDLSPDGKTLVFDMLGDLYLLPAEGGEALQITRGLAFDSQPRFSTNGTEILFVSDRNGSLNLWLLELGNKLIDTTSTGNDTGLKQVTNVKRSTFVSPEWTPDGNYIITTKKTYGTGNELWMYHKDGGTGINLDPANSRKNHIGAAFGPDERYLFTSSLGEGGYNQRSFQAQIHIFDRETGELYKITSEVGGAFRPALSPNGRWLIYGTRFDSQTGFRIRDMRNGETKWLTYPITRDDQEGRADRDYLPGYSFTPDSKAIITTINGKLFSVDVPSGERTQIPLQVNGKVDLAKRAHFEFRLDDGPVQAGHIRTPAISPDHDTVTFTALHRLYIMNLDENTPKKIAEMDENQFDPAWSADGNYIAFVTWSEDNGGSVYKVNVSSGKVTKLSEISAFYSQPCWRPDGSEIIVAKGPRNPEAERYWSDYSYAIDSHLIRLKSNGSGDKTYVSPLKGVRPHFTSDNDRIFIYEFETGNRHTVSDGSIISMRLDGSDRKEHLKIITDIKSIYAKNQTNHAYEALMGSDGTFAIVKIFNHIYRVEVPKAGEPVTIKVNISGKPNIPFKRLTKISGDYMGISQDGSLATWSLANKFFAFDLKNDHEEEAESYTVNIEAPRYMGKGQIVLKGATILTMEPGAPNDGIIKDASILIEDNRIKQVGPYEELGHDGSAEIIDVTGTYIIPGFIDLHSHMYYARGIHSDVTWQHLANLAYGVTTGRNPWGVLEELTTRDLLETGQLIGPRLLTVATPILDFDAYNEEAVKNFLRRYADEYFGTKMIKEYVSGDRITRQYITKYANEYGLTPTVEGARNMSLNITHMLDGYSGHEHAFPINPLYKDVMTLITETMTIYDPTLLVSYGGPFAEDYFYTTTNVHDDPKVQRFVPHDVIDSKTRRRNWFHYDEHIFHKHANMCKKIVEAGGRVTVGSHGQFNGIGYHWELWAIQSGGMSEMDALRCATIFGAEGIGLKDDLGSLEPGKIADLIVLTKNPLENIRNTTSIKYVMRSGVFYDADTLDELWPNRKNRPEFPWSNDDPVSSTE